MRIERFPTRAEALAAEQKAIMEENPIHNKRRNRIFGKIPRGPRDNAYGYVMVMRAIQARSADGASPQTWLATQLGVTRQAVHFWAKNGGIPAKHAPAVSRLTGLSEIEIRPEDIAHKLPGSIFDKISKQAKALGKGFGDHLVDIIMKGLGKHG